MNSIEISVVRPESIRNAAVSDDSDVTHSVIAINIIPCRQVIVVGAEPEEVVPKDEKTSVVPLHSSRKYTLSDLLADNAIEHGVE